MQETSSSPTVKWSVNQRRSRIVEATSKKSPYLDYAGAEEYTTLHRVTLWRAVRDGRLKASGYGRAVRFHVEDLEAFMAARNRK
jgi:excisionase family DNA binding protein